MCQIPRSIREAAAELKTAVDHLDVLVNNAGMIVDGDDALILEATPGPILKRRCAPTPAYNSVDKPFSR